MIRYKISRNNKKKE